MTEVYIIDSVDDILTVAKIRSEHVDMMIQRGWIRENSWITESYGGLVMSHNHMIEYLQEVAS